MEMVSPLAPDDSSLYLSFFFLFVFLVSVFMRKFYSVFDRKHMRMGFAVARHPGAKFEDEHTVGKRQTRVHGAATPDKDGECGEGAFFQLF